MIRVYVIAALVAFLATAGYGGYSYVTDLQKQVQTAAVESAYTKAALQSQTDAFAKVQDANARYGQLNKQLTTQLIASEQSLDQLRKLLADHDLTALAMAKPNLIETRINNATQSLFDQLEADTGGSVFERDR